MRFSRLPLFWRVFAINTAPLVVATLLLMFAPVTLHAPIRLTEAVVLSAGLAVILAANLLLLRPAFASLDRLVQRMHTVDLLRPGQRLSEGGGVEVAELVQGFNEMLVRLEEERRESGRRALGGTRGRAAADRSWLARRGWPDTTGVLLQLSSLADAGVAQRQGDLEEAKQATRQALEEVRRIAHELRPAALEHLGLVSALTELTTKFADLSGIVIDRHFDPDLPTLSPETELAIYRVAQESLTNVARHAEASHVEVSLEKGIESVVLRVLDDGRGFDEDGAAQRTQRAPRDARTSRAGRRRARNQGGARGRSRGQARSAGRIRLMPIPLVTRILVADDFPVVRSGLKRVLDDAARPRGRGRGGETALKRSQRPSSEDVHLAILDVSMPRMTGIQATAELAKRKPELRVLILSMHDSEQFLFEALKAGASGYVLKSEADQDIVEACRQTMRGQSFLYPSAVATLVRDYVERGRPDDKQFDILTPRELQVLKLIAEAKTSKEIAKELFISIKTVERHRQNILNKLGMSDRVELTRYAIRRGLIQA